MLSKLPNCHTYERNPERSLCETRTWKSVLECINTIFKNNQKYMLHDELCSGFKKLSFNHFEVPTEDFINTKLNVTDWKIHYVDGFISTYDFAQLVYNKFFPVNFAVRDFQNLYYSPEPYFAHDVLGHLPMLFYKPFQRILLLWAQRTINTKPIEIDELYYRCTLEIIKESKRNQKDESLLNSLEKEFARILQELCTSPTKIWKLGNFFDWSFEFGIIKSKNNPQIFGGAIVTSQHEINSVIQNIDRLQHITLDVIQRGISYTKNQKNYYYVNHFSEYEKLLDAI